MKRPSPKMRCTYPPLVLAATVLSSTLLARQTNAAVATVLTTSDANDTLTSTCPPPERRPCPGTPFAVLRDPARDCEFYDCPPPPPGWDDDSGSGGYGEGGGDSEGYSDGGGYSGDDVDWMSGVGGATGAEEDPPTVGVDGAAVDGQPEQEQEQGQVSTPPPCTVCTDIPTSNMLSRGHTCTTAIEALATRCHQSSAWVASTICQSSCYFAGRGYDGDVCCPEPQGGSTAYPTTQGPTVVPSGMPTQSPTSVPSGSASRPSNDEVNATYGEATIEEEEDVSINTTVTCDTPYGPKEVGELYFTSDGCSYCVCRDGGVPACTALSCPGGSSTVPAPSSAAATAPPSASPSALASLASSEISESSTTGTSIVCPADVLDCGNNITLSRDPAAGCEFGLPAATCPPPTMPPGTQYACEANFTGIYPVDMCLGFIWCRDGEYVAGPSVCPAGTLFDSACQCCRSSDEVACEVGFGGRRRHLYLTEKRDDGSEPTKQQDRFLRRRSRGD